MERRRRGVELEAAQKIPQQWETDDRVLSATPSSCMCCVWVCFLKTLLLTHLDDRSCSPLYFGSDYTILKGFPPCSRTCFSEPSFPPSLPSSIHPSVSSLARPCSGLHRGECVWDGVAAGLTGKQRFSPASKTSSWLSRVVPNVMKQYLGRLFSLPPTG